MMISFGIVGGGSFLFFCEGMEFALFLAVLQARVRSDRDQEWIRMRLNVGQGWISPESDRDQEYVFGSLLFSIGQSMAGKQRGGKPLNTRITRMPSRSHG
jgi:hypothetical protein